MAPLIVIFLLVVWAYKTNLFFSLTRVVGHLEKFLLFLIYGNSKIN